LSATEILSNTRWRCVNDLRVSFLFPAWSSSAGCGKLPGSNDGRRWLKSIGDFRLTVERIAGADARMIEPPTLETFDESTELRSGKKAKTCCGAGRPSGPAGVSESGSPSSSTSELLSNLALDEDEAGALSVYCASFRSFRNAAVCWFVMREPICAPPVFRFARSAAYESDARLFASSKSDDFSSSKSRSTSRCIASLRLISLRRNFDFVSAAGRALKLRTSWLSAERIDMSSSMSAPPVGGGAPASSGTAPSLLLLAFVLRRLFVAAPVAVFVVFLLLFPVPRSSTFAFIFRDGFLIATLLAALEAFDAVSNRSEASSNSPSSSIKKSSNSASPIFRSRS